MENKTLPSTYVSNTENKGRGIFAGRRVLKGEIVEKALVIILTEEDVELIKQMTLSHYYYSWKEDHGAVALGNGSIYNHSPNPNVDFNPDYVNEVIVYTANRDIEKDEELLINYDVDLWFEVK